MVAHRNIIQQAAGGGRECQGPNQKQKPCARLDCSRDCKWTEWSAWSPCSVTCGEGTQTSNRSVLLPAVGTGKECLGSKIIRKACSTSSCPRDCTWSGWSSWGKCSTTCGEGTRLS